MLSTSVGMVLIGEGIVSFCNNTFALSLSVATVKIVEIAVENLLHSDKMTAYVQQCAIGREYPSSQGFLYYLTPMPKPQRCKV